VTPKALPRRGRPGDHKRARALVDGHARAHWRLSLRRHFAFARDAQLAASFGDTLLLRATLNWRHSLRRHLLLLATLNSRPASGTLCFCARRSIGGSVFGVTLNCERHPLAAQLRRHFEFARDAYWRLSLRRHLRLRATLSAAQLRRHLRLRATLSAAQLRRHFAFARETRTG
jgi:hypothetical protein